MRSVRSLRNPTIKSVFKPVWLYSSRYQKCDRSISSCKRDEQRNQEESQNDPYEANFEFTECDQYAKVTVIGAAGRVGRVLSLLLKTCPLIDHLCLFDVDKSVKGIGVDISHIDTKCCVSHICGMKNIYKALDAPDVVVIAAGVPSSPQLSVNELFEKNAPIVAGLSEACARFCPKACIILITSPINSLLPVVGEVYQIITNKIPHRKLFGLTTLDVVRANTFVGEVVRKDPNNIIVPVIGGSSPDTIVPVISQMKPCSKIKRGEILALTECIKRAEGNLTDCQNCGTRGASSLSTAYAAFRFTSSLVMALKGAENIVECAYVRSDIIPELEYLASPVKLGIRGIEYNFGYPPLSENKLNEDYPELDFLLQGESVRCQSSGPSDLRKILKQKLFSSQNAVWPNVQQVRQFCSAKKNLMESDDSKNAGDKFKSYIREDRKKIAVPTREYSNENLNDSVQPIIGNSFDNLVIKPVWNCNIEGNNFKCLKTRARQKFRAFNNKKKIKKSESIFLMMDKTKKEKAERKITTDSTNEKPERGLEMKNKEKEVINLPVKEGEIIKNDTTLVISGKEEQDFGAFYREFICYQLEELRKENEELKKKILQIGEDLRPLKPALREQTDHLELEKTKMKACWLMVTSALETFANFFKKSTKKNNQKFLPPFENREDEESDVSDSGLEGGEKKPNESYDEKYYNFLENLMKEEEQCQEGKCMGK